MRPIIPFHDETDSQLHYPGLSILAGCGIPKVGVVIAQHMAMLPATRKSNPPNTNK